jgi:hypothetical protein
MVFAAHLESGKRAAGPRRLYAFGASPGERLAGGRTSNLFADHRQPGSVGANAMSD